MDWGAVETGVIVGLFSGAGGSYLSARWVPHFEHRYWQAQRLFEARSAAAAELKRLYAVYLAGHIAKTTEQDPNWRPSREFWVAWHAMELDIEALFSGRTRAAVRGVEALMTANGGIGNPADRPRKNEQDFIEAGGAAMRALYEEIGLRLPAA